MPWIVMNDGAEVSLAYPSRDVLSPKTIAHHLSTINRFTGAALRPYSVAEHSLLVADLLRDHFHLDVHAQFAGLMHDAHEAITGDQSTPSKSEIGPGWDLFEDRFADLVSVHFRCRTALICYQREIRLADRMALYIERQHLLPHLQPCGSPSTPWPVFARLICGDDVDLMSEERQAMSWRQWRDLFINRFIELDDARRVTEPSMTHALHIHTEAS